ncbi:MAG: poly(3-hydroxyalkanoate) synthetase, partial [Desulfobacteraceae bacterium 4572_88]
NKRPIVIIDPRAGHGPGIGGSKRDSEIGVALTAGHPVYFVLFYTDPMPGQTLADVQKAQVQFIEEVARHHPDAGEPAVIGNCQAGWAAALIGADRPDVTGPLVLNGSPLSYWAGVDGRNPMRYRGGLIGGIWFTSFLSDLGNDQFDGANLVANFEDLNPANTYWQKQYNLYAKIDTEDNRYLRFERWWNGYFLMASEEINFIVSNLFVGNHLEQGKLDLDKDTKIDLKNLEDPIVVFSSTGDNITPPQQALNWIAKVYDSVADIKHHQQVIVYMVHKEIGHLGIFVSGKVAKKEHKEIIETIDMIEYLPYGLYEMVIEEKGEKLGVSDYYVRFERREIEDILAHDDGQEDEDQFRYVAAISEANNILYNLFLSPWVRMLTTPLSAEMIRQLHPMRVSRYAFSDLNPFLLPIRASVPAVRKNRKPAAADNTFAEIEKKVSEQIAFILDSYRDVRDLSHEYLFKLTYGSPWMQFIFPTTFLEKTRQDREKRAYHAHAVAREDDAVRDKGLMTVDKGGFPEGIVRIMLAMADADNVFDREQFMVAEKLVQVNRRLRKLKRNDFKQMLQEQASILDRDRERSLQALSQLLPSQDDRTEAVEIAKSIAYANPFLADKEEAMLKKIGAILDVAV